MDKRSLVILLLEQRVGSLSKAQRDRISILNLTPFTAVVLGRETQRGLSLRRLILLTHLPRSLRTTLQTLSVELALGCELADSDLS